MANNRRKAFRLVRAIPVGLLALLAAPGARAGFILDPNVDCVADNSLGACSVAQGNSPGNSISVFTTVDFAPMPGGTEIGLRVENGGASGNVFQGEIIPVSWDFIVHTNNGISSETLNWSVEFDVDGQNALRLQFFTNGTTHYGSHVTGSGTLVVDTDDSLASYSIFLTGGGDDDRYSITIPGGTSLDLNAAATSTPEPGPVLLCGLGGVALAICRYRRVHHITS